LTRPGGGAGWTGGTRSPGCAFDTDMHRLFFGRRGEVSKLAELLRSPLERADRGCVGGDRSVRMRQVLTVRAGLLPVMAGEPGW